MWSSALEAIRRRRAPPESRLVDAGLERGMRVADVGAGYGFFAFPAAEMVGDEGMVYAVEPNQKRAAEISRRADERRAKNLKVIVAGAEEMGEIPTGGVDFAISMSSFHHFANQQSALDEIGRVVKPGGKVYIRDIKAGRVFKHGSNPKAFQEVVRKRFPSAGLEEGPGYLVARIGL